MQSREKGSYQKMVSCFFLCPDADCSRINLNGMPPKRIQKVMGHETLEQTLEYIRSTNDDLEDSQFFNLLNQAAPDNVIPMKTKVG